MTTAQHPEPPSRRAHRRASPRRLALAGLAAATALALAIADHQRDARAQPGPDGPTLATRVESLRAFAGEPEPAPRLLERLATLWEWSNGLTLRGVVLPADFPLLLYDHRLALTREPLDPGAIPAAAAFLRRLTAELAAKERDPGVVGRVALATPGPFVAGEVATVVQTWTVGSRGMTPGGGVVAFRSAFGPWQAEDPAAAGFVSVRSSRPGALFATAAPWGPWESFLVRQSVGWRLSGAALEPGDTVTITYGDTSGRGPGVRVQPHSNDAAVLPILVDLDGRGDAWTPSWPSFEVRARPEVVRLSAIAPSVVGIGEAFALALRAEDRFMNPSGTAAPGGEVHLDGERVRSFPAGAEAVTVIDDLRLDRAGVHRFEVVSADGALRARSNPVLASAGPRPRVLWGDLHGHTGLADGQGSIDGYFGFGRDMARLDFLSLSEHDALVDDAEWAALVAGAARYDDPGRFTTLLGYEWTQYNQAGGHHNVYFRTREGRRRVPVQETLTTGDLYRRLRRENRDDDLLVVPHAHESADWREGDPAVERLVEISSGHGTFEYFGNRYLERGWRVGFVAASDNHGGHPGSTGSTNAQPGGLAAVLADANHAPAIFDALRERRAYATTGERILLDCALDGAAMGSVVPGAPEHRLDCGVHGTAPLDAVVVVRDGEVVWSRGLPAGEPGPAPRVQLALESSSEVWRGPVNPRGERPWRVAIDVRGATLAGVELSELRHPQRTRVERPPGEPGRALLTLATRGRAHGVVLALQDASRATSIHLAWEAAREAGPRAGATMDMAERTPQELPGGELEVTLAGLAEGPHERALEVGRNVDRIRLRLLPSDPPLDTRFSFSEPAPGGGAYYYVRATQIDGATAWSSPWWVAGPR